MAFGFEIVFGFRKLSDIYYTSRLFNQNGEACLEKSPPVSDKLSITHSLK